MNLVEAIEQLEDLREKRKSFVLLKDYEALETILKFFQPIKKIIAPSRRKKKNTYEFGLIVGTKRERNYWQDKIREKIEEIKARMNDDCLALHEFQRIAKIDVLQNLLKEE